MKYKVKAFLSQSEKRAGGGTVWGKGVETESIANSGEQEGQKIPQADAMV